MVLRISNERVRNGLKIVRNPKIYPKNTTIPKYAKQNLVYVIVMHKY